MVLCHLIELGTPGCRPRSVVFELGAPDSSCRIVAALAFAVRAPVTSRALSLLKLDAVFQITSTSSLFHSEELPSAFEIGVSPCLTYDALPYLPLILMLREERNHTRLQNIILHSCVRHSYPPPRHDRDTNADYHRQHPLHHETL